MAGCTRELVFEESEFAPSETGSSVDGAESGDRLVGGESGGDAGDRAEQAADRDVDWLQDAGLFGDDAGGTEGGTAAEACVTEVCNGRDDDCDGDVDEDFLLGAACEGACGRGAVECDGEGGVLCSTDPSGSGYSASQEACNGRDDDCNGIVDDVEGLGEACSGPDTCGTGEIECRGDARVCSTGPGGSAYRPTQEVCNGVDDDCDGETDEGFAVGAECSVPGICGQGVTECASRTETRCSSGPLGSNDRSSREVCDGLDNDCDGSTDEGVKNACGLCGPEPEEVCNGFDDDCDGEVDEGVKNACGYCGPVPLEICNGIDDNCDGEVDDGLPTYGYYPDCDGDGFGRRDAPVVQDCRPPSGCAQVLNNDDCNDQDADVHPAQQAFFSDAVQGSFDYDCSGAAEREFPVTRADCQGLVCFANGYWDTDADEAPCGVLWRYCAADNDFCEACGSGLCLRTVMCR